MKSQAIDATNGRRPYVYLAGAVIFYAVVTFIGHQFSVWNGYVDLEVYRAGARTWLDGHPLYGELPAVQDGKTLPFTYPPLAAIVFAPLAMMPTMAAQWAVFASTVLALAAVLWMTLRLLRPNLDRTTTATLVVLLVTVFQFVEPIRTTLGFGQINVVLMVIIVLETMAPRLPWPRGLLLGIVVAIKLTPAAFILFFLVRRDYRAAVMTVVGTALAVGVGYLVMPANSNEYWFHTMFDTGRIGSPDFAMNQSIHGWVARLGLADRPTTILWLALSAIVVIAAWFWMQRLNGQQRYLALLLVNALVVLLISPVSWTHHWVWVAPALVYAFCAIGDGLHNRWFFGITAISVVVFSIGPQWLLPRAADVERDWNWWQQILGNSYLLIGVCLLIAGCGRLLTHREPAVTGTMDS